MNDNEKTTDDLESTVKFCDDQIKSANWSLDYYGKMKAEAEQKLKEKASTI